MPLGSALWWHTPGTQHSGGSYTVSLRSVKMKRTQTPLPKALGRSTKPVGVKVSPGDKPRVLSLQHHHLSLHFCLLSQIQTLHAFPQHVWYVQPHTDPDYVRSYPASGFIFNSYKMLAHSTTSSFKVFCLFVLPHGPGWSWTHPVWALPLYPANVIFLPALSLLILTLWAKSENLLSCIALHRVMPLQRGCQQPGRVHRYSLRFCSHCRCLPSLKHFRCLQLPSLSTRPTGCFSGLREQSNVMYYFVLEVGQHSRWFLDIWSCPFQPSIQILYPFFIYSQLYFLRLDVNHENFCQATRVCTEHTRMCWNHKALYLLLKLSP